MATSTTPVGIRPQPTPPDGFDPRAASPLELRRYGLPQRPDPAVQPHLAARWDAVFSRELRYIAPEFTPVQELVPGIQRQPRVQPDMTVTNPTWSGTVVHAPKGQAFGWVTGEWNVPDVMPGGDGPGIWQCLSWIGIDGDTDVTQIGTLQLVSTENPYLLKQCYAWFEWYPDTWHAISNFPVSFGDTMSGLVCLLSPTEASYSMINITQRTHTGWRYFSAPGNTTSLENQVEWVLERPFVGGAQAQLPNFGEIYFDSAVGGEGLENVVSAGQDTVINMTENGNTVATTTVETPTLIKIAYTGP
ncbi:MAG: G1 family glutamic endopeptidase [Streptosporangiaceae bacterium]